MNMTVTPFVRAGWQKMGVSFSSDSGYQDVDMLELNSVNLKFADANLWIGEAGCTVRFGDGFSFFANASANASRKILVETPIEPEDQNDPVEWDGSKLEWWQAECGLTYPFVSDDYWLIGGFRIDHLSVTLDNPRDAAPNEYGDWVYLGDFRAKIWIPYFGVQVTGYNCTGTLIGSPFAWTDFKLPFATTVIDDAPDFEESRYTLKTSGYFVECSAEYNVDLGSRASLGVWGKGSLISMRGEGDNKHNPTGEARSGSATYMRRNLAVGASASVSF